MWKTREKQGANYIWKSNISDAQGKSLFLLPFPDRQSIRFDKETFFR